MTEKNQNIISTESQSKPKKRNQNQRKLLPKIIRTNNSYSNSKLKKRDKFISIGENNLCSKNIQTSPNNNILTQSFDFIKKIKEAKEIKDLEKIYNKWRNEKELISRNKEDAIKIEIYNNKKENNENSNHKKIHTEKNEEKRKMVEKLKVFKKQKAKRANNSNNNENIDIKKIAKGMNRHLSMIYQKSNLILNKEFQIENIKRDDFGEILEYIIDISRYHEKEIKLNESNNLLLPEEAIEYKDNSIIKILGYFGSELALNHIKVLIEKIPTNEILREITFKIISIGIATNKVYKIKLDNDDYKFMFNEDIEKWFLFLDNIKKRMSLIFNISSDIIYIFGHNLYNFEAYLLIYNRKINNVEKTLKNFDLKVESNSLLNNIVLSPSIFNINFCKNEDEWPEKNLVRGGRKYSPPYGWIGIALNVKNRYNKNKKNSKEDSKEKDDDNIWLGKNNTKGEWPVAYHGVGKGDVFKKVLNILNSNLREGPGQLFQYNLNVEKNRDKYNNCGEGVYLSPNIKEAMKYADKITLGVNDLLFKFVIMARVHPEKIRSPGGTDSQVDWILNGNDEEIRPYRLLIKIYDK